MTASGPFVLDHGSERSGRLPLVGVLEFAGALVMLIFGVVVLLGGVALIVAGSARRR